MLSLTWFSLSRWGCHNRELQRVDGGPWESYNEDALLGGKEVKTMDWMARPYT